MEEQFVENVEFMRNWQNGLREFANLKTTTKQSSNPSAWLIFFFFLELIYLCYNLFLLIKAMSNYFASICTLLLNCKLIACFYFNLRRESWNTLLEHIDNRDQKLYGAGEIHRFNKDVEDALSRMQVRYFRL